MSTYRDDLGAAVARADALHRELEEVKRHRRVERVRIAELERLLVLAQRELAERHGAEPRHVILQDGLRLQPFALGVGAILLLGTVTLLVTLCVRGDRPPDPPAPTIEIVQGVVPAAGRLRVESRPAGGLVEVDGAVVGTTPLMVELARGDHAVAVRSGQRVQRQHVSIAGEIALELDFATLGATEVRDALGDLPSRMRACGLAGRLDLHLAIAADGRVLGATARVGQGGSWAALGREGRACLERGVAAVRFPAAPEPTSAIVPLFATPEE